LILFILESEAMFAALLKIPEEKALLPCLVDSLNKAKAMLKNKLFKMKEIAVHG
jgi:hypothetical protein